MVDSNASASNRVMPGSICRTCTDHGGSLTGAFPRTHPGTNTSIDARMHNACGCLFISLLQRTLNLSGGGSRTFQILVRKNSQVPVCDGGWIHASACPRFPLLASIRLFRCIRSSCVRTIEISGPNPPRVKGKLHFVVLFLSLGLLC